MITDWNWPRAVPGRGSAIFIHQWRSPGAPTAGCIAMARQNLIWLVNGLMPEARLIVR
jgi:L,D-peptidoglycan transpeptidase YkuD (ErfK/YbiS/YcfS/YnhG family)